MKKYLAALLVLAAGCLGSTDNNFFFSYDVQRLDAAPTTPITVTTENVISGALQVRSTTSTPCFTDQITLEGDRQGTLLLLNLNKQSVAGACTDTRVRYHNYSAIFSGVQPGTYELRIVNNISSAGTVDYDQQITIK
ncbi:MAG TPA: hypothetical protein VFQ39_05305 [Longimicrobium sp.]|nr:hypothetical protein [Longimicrobium sp.]